MSIKGLSTLITTAFIVLVAIIVGLKFVEKVPEGKVAVVYSPADGAKEVLEPGWHAIGFFEKTQQYPTRIETVETEVSVTTSDGKKIKMPVSYQMKVDKSKVLDIFKELGSQKIDQIQDGYLQQNLFKVSRSVVSGYSVLDIFGTKTTEASEKVSEKLAEATEGLGFIITNVTLGNPEVDDATQKAIDQRVQAAQENELKKQQLENEKIEAEKKKVIAEGEAQAAIIAAQGQAQANKELEVSITPELLQKMEMEARIKHGWVTIQGAQAVVTQ